MGLYRVRGSMVVLVVYGGYRISGLRVDSDGVRG